MGSERKSKDKSRKRSSSDSHSEDESQAKKKHRKSRHGDAQGSKTNKSHPSSRKDKKHKSKDSKRGPQSSDKITELSTDDYFSKNNEFATWLKEEKRKFFSDLSTDSARELFTEFVEEWNTHKLKTKFYEGIKTGPRSSHKWKIKN